jgi:hypothetical protein
MLPGVPGAIFCLAYSQYRGQDNVPCTTRLAFIILTEPAPMYTLVGGLAAVVAFVKATANAEEMTGCAKGAAELDIRTHFNDHVIKLST